MAIAIDATSQGVGNPVSSITVSHTCTGANLFLAVLVNIAQGDLIVSITYPKGATPTALTLANKTSPNGGAGAELYLYYMVAPDTGANNIVVVVTGTDAVRVAAASYTGVSQGAIDSSNTGVGNSGTLTAATTVVASSCWLVGAGYSDTGVTLVAGAQTFVRKIPTGNAYIALLDSNGTVGTGSQALTATSNSGLWNMNVLSVAPVAAAGPANVKTKDGVTQSTGIKTYEGLALASVKSVEGVT